MSKVKKGQYGYFDGQKKSKFLTSVICLAIPVFIIYSSQAYFGTNKNIFTVIGMIGLVPFAMSLVSTIMFAMRKSIPASEHDAIAPHEGNLTVGYELYMTDEKKNSLVDCVCICGNEVVCLVTDPKTDQKFLKEHIIKHLKIDEFYCNVHILGDLKHFTERMDEMNEHADSLRKGLRFSPDERYPGFGREDMILHTLCTISL